MSREPHEIILVKSLQNREPAFFSLVYPIDTAKRYLARWEPVVLVLVNGQKVIVRRKEVWT